METIFEAKADIPFGSEHSVARKLNLEFVREHSDTDYYIKSDGETTTKIKRMDDGNSIIYEFSFDGSCLKMACTNISDNERDKLLAASRQVAVLKTRKRVYFSKELGVNIEIDYIEQLPKRLFLEIVDDDRDKVLNAKRRVGDKLGIINFLSVSYDKLVPGQVQ